MVKAHTIKPQCANLIDLYATCHSLFIFPVLYILYILNFLNNQKYQKNHYKSYSVIYLLASQYFIFMFGACLFLITQSTVHRSKKPPVT